MNPERRTLLKAIGGIAATGALAGCITSSDDGDDDGSSGNGDANGDSDEAQTGTVRMWSDFTEAEEEDVDSFIDQFESQTGHTINREGVSELDSQLETAMPAGEGPETWAWAHDWVGRFAIRDDPPFLYDASDDISVDLDVYSGAAQAAVQFDGGVYGLPFSAETVTLFYNKEMVDEPPETMAEMVETMQEFHDPANNQYGLSYPATDPYFASGFLQAFGGTIYDEDSNEVTVDADECVEGLEVLQSDVFDYIPADPGYESQKVVFADGIAPFAINGPWELGNFNEALEDVGVAQLPTVDGNHPRTYSGIQMWYFSAELADADEADRQAAIDWAEWYTTTEDVSLTNADNHGLIPVHTEHAEADGLSAEVQAFSQQIDHGTPIPTHPDMDSVWDPVGNALTRVFNGDQDPQPALEQAASDIRESL